MSDELIPDHIAALSSIATSTLAHQLQMRGIRSAFFSGLKALRPELRMVGRARTLRYVALREDLQQQYGGGINAQRRAVESLKPGDVLVIEARGVADAATIGDIFATRAFSLGATGIVTDGALRDTPAIAELNRPVYHLSSHGATLGRQHMPFSVDEPVTCAGVFVVPGDVIVGDGEGAVVIPIALVADVVRDALAQEERERFALERVAAGESTVGLFPLAKERAAEFERWRATKGARPHPGPSRSIAIEGLSHLTGIPVASRIGPLLVSSVIAPFDPGTRTVPSGYPAQYANIFRHVGEMLKAAGGDWRHVAKMEFWVPVAEARDACEAPWNERFPDAQSRPARHTHVVPDAKAVSASFIAYIDD